MSALLFVVKPPFLRVPVEISIPAFIPINLIIVD